MHQHQGVGRPGSDPGRRHDRLAEGGGRRKHAGIVREQRLRGRLLLAGALALEGRFDRAPGIAFVPPPDLDAERSEHLFRLIEASARQGHVVRQQFGAADDAGSAEGRQAHRLVAVELGILECGQTGEPVDQGGRETAPVDVHLIAQHDLDRLRQQAADGNIRLSPRRRRQPRRLVLIHDRQSYAEYATAPARFLGHVADLDRRHAPDRGQEPPLVGMRLEVVVQEHAVARLAWRVLQRQRDEVAEPAGRHGVLAGKQAVVGLEPDVRVPFHRLGEEPSAETPSRRRGNRIGEEDPHVTAPARPRPFQRGRNSAGRTGRKEHGGVPAPRVLVESMATNRQVSSASRG